MIEYILESKRKDTNGDCRRLYFSSPHDVAIFLWGRDLAQWTIYQEQLGLTETHDISALAEELKRREDLPRLHWLAKADGIPLKDLPKWKAGQKSKKK